MKISTFTIIKNEAEFVGYGIMSVLDYVDEMVFADGNSKDGTLEIIKYIKKKYDKDNKIKLFENKDCRNLKWDYVKLFNWTLKQCSGDYVWFLHPDMIITNPQKIRDIQGDAIRYFVNMESIAGDDRQFLITEGRDKKWSTIYKNDYGLHYYGFYGSIEEDLYFKDITGDEHTFYKQIRYLPYEIKDTSIQIYHYCDTKPYSRRLGRMMSCLKNIYPMANVDNLLEFAKTHPRVSLESGLGFGKQFVIEKNNLKIPDVFKKYDFSKFKKEIKK